ncbi:hypothetical protein GTQ40_05685 [Flavobacteriaceae bacterium R38]|nr:hypothetical protein [Flavobacteriaceae bacterium R38]
MIKIFRKIRLGLLEEDSSAGRLGKLGKYLIYAIGEIVLVVIGILIALQLNNRNERISTYKKQENHLLLIKGEMINNIKTIDEISEALMTIIESSRTIINLMASDEDLNNINEDELSGLIVQPLSREIKIYYENGALTELISSGGLKDIRNDSIRSILASWESKLTIVRLQEKALREALVKSNYYMQLHGSYRTVFDGIEYSDDLKINRSSNNNSNKGLMKSQEFENILLNYLAVADHLHQRVYPNFKDELQSLIDLIDNELNL